MRICFISHNMRRGGTPNVIHNLVETFIESNHEIHLLLFQNIIEYDLNSKIHIHIANKNFLSRIKIMKHHLIKKTIEKEIQDMEHQYGTLDAIFSCALTFHKNYSSPVSEKMIFCIHSSLHASIKRRKGVMRSIITNKIRKIYNKKNIITVSMFVYDELKSLGIFPKNIEVIPNPFNYNKINRLSKEKPSDLPGNYIVYVGRLAKEKRLDILLHAYKISNIKQHLFLVGQGNEKEELVELCDKYGISDKVHFLGNRLNPYPYMKNARLLVLSSSYETFGNVLIESFALNTPVVCTDCGNTRHLMERAGLNDFMADINSPFELACKIKQAIKKQRRLNLDFLEDYESSCVANKYIEFAIRCNNKVSRASLSQATKSRH